MSDIKVSIIVPVYNVEEYIKECLDSLVNQTLREIEVLIVDDGSTDSSGEIATEYANKYANFHVFKQENSGQSVARNNGVNFARGEYLGFVDSDDYVSDDAYEKLYEMTQNGKIDIVTGNVIRFNSKGFKDSILHKRVFKDCIKKTKINNIPELLNDATSCNKIYKTKFWIEKNLKFPEGVIYEDIPLTGIAYMEANSIAILSDFIYYWRIRESSNKSTSQKTDNINNFIDRMYCLNILDEFIKNNNIDESVKYQKWLKNLEIDLKNFINALDRVGPDYIREFILISQKYLETIPNYVFDDIKAIDKIQYYFLSNNNIHSLLEAIYFEKNEIKYLEVEQEGNKYYGKFPFKEIPKKYFEMTKELNKQTEIQEITEVDFNNGILTIKGFIIINRLNLDRKNKVKLTARIVNESNGKEMDVFIDNIQFSSATTRFSIMKRNCKKRNDRLYNYNWSGYKIELNLKTYEFLDLGIGKFHLVVNFKTKGIDRDIVIKRGKEILDINPYSGNNRNIQFKYNPIGKFYITVQMPKFKWFIEKIKKNFRFLKKNSSN